VRHSEVVLPAAGKISVKILSAVFVLACLLITFKPAAHAVPSYSRQTGLPAFPLSVIFDAPFTETKSPQPGTQNGNLLFPQAASLFLAGKWASHVGSFVQITYDSQGDHFSWDNTDIAMPTARSCSASP
jgi:hypothetical protein